MAKKTNKQSAVALFAGMNSYSGNTKKTDTETGKETVLPVSVEEENIKTEETVSVNEAGAEEQSNILSNILYNTSDEKPDEITKATKAVPGKVTKKAGGYIIKKPTVRTKNPHSLYLSDSLWEKLQQTAAENGVSVSDLVEQLLSQIYN